MQKKYEWIKDCYYRNSVRWIYFRKDGKFLLVRDEFGFWILPGWWIDHWEEPHEALRREIHEEMWLDLTYISNQPKYFYLCQSNEVHWNIRPLWQIVYEVRFKNLDFTISNECLELWFFSLEEAMKNIKIHSNAMKFFKIMEKEKV